MRANNTRKSDLIKGHFYQLKEKSGESFVGEYLGQQADEFSFLFPERQVSLYSFRVNVGGETLVCGYTKDQLPKTTKDLGAPRTAEEAKSA